MYLSEADNWYVPGRLTEEMNHLLEETEAPFGKVVAALHPFRRTFETKLLWSPLPSGWEIGARAEEDAPAPAAPHAVIEHRALVYGEDQRPFRKSTKPIRAACWSSRARGRGKIGRALYRLDILSAGR